MAYLMYIVNCLTQHSHTYQHNILPTKGDISDWSSGTSGVKSDLKWQVVQSHKYNSKPFD